MNDTWADETIDGELGADDRTRVKAELDPDERLVWLGRPIAALAPVGRAIPLFFVLNVAAWLAAVLCIVAIGLRGWGNGDAAGATAFSLAVAVILSLGLSAYFVGRRSTRDRLGRTLYALTGRRAIIWRPSARAGGVEVYSVARGGVKRVHRVEFPDGSGDVIFQQPTETDIYWAPPGFEKVPEVVRVERLVREALLSDERT